MTTYQDPSNMDEIIKELKEMKTMGDVNELAKKTFPGWIIATLPRFCDGYPHLNTNWVVLCKRIGVKPTQILIVKELSMSDDHKLLRMFIECFTQAGFSVRAMTDYIPCAKCEVVAVPTPEVYGTMKEKGLKIPEINTMLCSDCS